MSLTKSDEIEVSQSIRVVGKVDLKDQEEDLRATFRVQYAEHVKRGWYMLVAGLIASLLGAYMAFQSNQIFSFGHMLVAGGVYYFLLQSTYSRS